MIVQGPPVLLEGVWERDKAVSNKSYWQLVGPDKHCFICSYEIYQGMRKADVDDPSNEIWLCGHISVPSELFLGCMRGLQNEHQSWLEVSGGNRMIFTLRESLSIETSGIEIKAWNQRFAPSVADELFKQVLR